MIDPSCSCIILNAAGVRQFSALRLRGVYIILHPNVGLLGAAYYGFATEGQEDI